VIKNHARERITDSSPVRVIKRSNSDITGRVMTAAVGTDSLPDAFTVGGHKMDGPHDPLAPPEETISCRCTLTYDLDTDTVPGRVDSSFEANLGVADARRLTEIVNDSNIKFTLEQAHELDAIKHRYLDAYLQKIGLVDPEARRFTLEHGGVQLLNWSTSGKYARTIADKFENALAIKDPPVWKKGLFDGKKYDFYDFSAEQLERSKIAEWYFFRAQQAYAQRVALVRGTSSLQVSRGVFGDYAREIGTADWKKQDWTADVYALSSWSEMVPGVKKSIEKLVRDSTGKGNKPVWLTTTVDADDVVMHWAGEMVFRYMVGAKGEIIVRSRTGKLTSDLVKVGTRHVPA
jgi:hypothetical protein